MSGDGNSKWLSWFDRVLMILAILTHGGGVFDHFKNVVRASLAGWIPPLFVLAAYLLFWVLYRVRISRHHGAQFKLIARVFLVVSSVAVILMFIPPQTVVTQLPSEPQVLVADVENKTGDSTFPVDALRRTLSIALKESSQIALLPDNKLQDTLRRMGKSPNERVSVNVGREVCLREGVGLLIAPAVSKLEDGYRLETMVLDPKTGQTLYETTVGPFAREAGVTDLCRKLANNLRNKFGESSLHIYRTAKPLAAATSKSTEAVESYSEALKYLAEFNYSLSEERLKNALELDHDFALAWVELASIYDQRGNTPGALACSARAFSLRERLTEPERIRVDDFYYWHVENNHQKAFAQLNEFLAKYPRNQDRFGSLAYEASMLMKFNVAEEASQKELGSRPWGESAEESSYGLWDVQLARDEFSQALETARSIQEDIPKAKYLSYIATVPKLVSEREAAKLDIGRLRQTKDTSAALWLGGLLDIYGGKLQSTFDQWLQYSQLKQSEKETPWTPVGKAHLALARIALLAGKKSDARSQLRLAQKEELRDEYLAEVGKYYARLGDKGDNDEANNLLIELRKRVAGRETNQNLALLQLLEGEVELLNGHLDQSFALISAAASYPWSYSYFAVQESLGNVARKTGHYAIAIQAFKAILDRKGLATARDCPDVWIIANYDAGRSYEAAGDKSMALSYYLQFEQLWHGGDATLPALVDVRNQLAKLKG